MSQQGRLIDLSSNLETLTGNSGGAVGPDGSGDINIIGSGSISVTGNPGTNTLTITDSGSIATTYTTDSGSATPAANILNVLGGTLLNTAGAGDTVTINADDTVVSSIATDSATVTPSANAFTISGGIGISTSGSTSIVTTNLDVPVLLANGGTGSTTFTAGSVVFSNGTILTQDNANLFYDDTNNRLGLGITTPLDTFHVVGAMELDHTAAENDDHALEIVCDANGFADVKALDIDFITGTLGAAQDEEAIIVNIDESASTGGIMAGYLVLTTSEGLATVNGYETGININPVVQQSGTFGDADSILNKAVDVTAALASGGAGAISIFVADNDTLTIGDAAQWGEFEIILSTGASGSGVAPTFEYSTGGAAFSTFVPADGTNGFRNTGAILWDASSLAGWATAASGLYEIRITRTRNTLATTPIIDELQIAALTEYKWDKNGDVNINSLTLVTDLAVANGGTGASSLTDGGILLGSGTGAITATAQPTNGQLLIGSTGVDPVLATLTAGTGISIVEGAGTITVSGVGGGITWNVETGASANMAVNNGYFANYAGTLAFTLPSTAAVGDTMQIAQMAASQGWSLAQNAGQTCYIGNTATTTGVGGSLASTDDGDWIEIVCRVADTDFQVNVKSGNITVV